MPMSKFWNKKLETMPRRELQKLQLKRLKHIVKKAYDNNKFYHDLYKSHGVKPDDIKILEDLRKLPFLEKKTVRTAYPYGTALVPRNEILELHTTSGTTGKPTPCFATRKDIEYWADAFILECIDPKTDEWVDEGEPGELVWTWISADGTGMIRYRSRDLSSVWWAKKCGCGRTHPKFAAVKGRTDDSVSIGGFIVYPSQVEEALMRHPEIGANFRMIIESVKGLDKLTVKAEIKDKKLLKDKPKLVN